MSANPAARPTTQPKSKVIRDFGGVNLRAVRQSIEDNEFAWLENAQPVGHGNLRICPTPSSTLRTIAGQTVIYSVSVNIGGFDYIYAVMQSGHIYQVLAFTPYTATQITAGSGPIFGANTMIAQWKNAGVVIIDTTAGYYDYNITAAATLTLIDVATKGSTIASYAGRVWIGNNRTVKFTDVDSYNSFAGAGGAFTISDETLHSAINDLAVANGFLYIVGDSSFDILGNVQVTAGVTSFTRQNVTASVGSKYPMSIFPYYRGLLFANQYGFYSLAGSTPQKLSANLDLLMPAINFGSPISGGQAICNNILCAAFCFTLNDSFTTIGGTRPILAVFFDGKWFFATQGANLKLVVGLYLTGSVQLYGWSVSGSDSTLSLIFNATGNTVRAIVKTKLFDGESPLVDKNMLRAGLGIDWNGKSNSGATISVTGDNENGAQAISGIIPSPMPTTGYRFCAASANTAGGKYVGLTIDATVREIIFTQAAVQWGEGAQWSSP